MARKDGTPRVTPDLSTPKRDPRDFTLLAETDEYKLEAAHENGQRYIILAAKRPSGLIILNESETDELAQAVLDAREELRR